MDDERWAALDDYIGAEFALEDPALSRAQADSDEAGLPHIAVSATQAKMLELLATISGARRILEVGTLGGYSAISLARALPRDGRLVTLELEDKHARVARANLERAGLAHLVEVRVGPAADSLRSLAAAHEEPFDFIFIDANKNQYPEYLELSLELSRPGTVIVADNVVRNGEVANAASADANVRAVREFLDLAARDPRLSGTVIQTVGAKGYDGFALLLVR
ncbi:MAG TPA: O-methyltransferase [Acidimicrobiales bacterium]|nr:O-methyltransferase [Acidimicrobiales bacterium]